MGAVVLAWLGQWLCGIHVCKLLLHQYSMGTCTMGICTMGICRIAWAFIETNAEVKQRGQFQFQSNALVSYYFAQRNGAPGLQFHIPELIRERICAQILSGNIKVVPLQQRSSHNAPSCVCCLFVRSSSCLYFARVMVHVDPSRYQGRLWLLESHDDCKAPQGQFFKPNESSPCVLGTGSAFIIYESQTYRRLAHSPSPGTKLHGLRFWKFQVPYWWMKVQISER